jgi:mRNA-degrading endonuclease toxin of MazEF toxin-antitoxin module
MAGSTGQVRRGDILWTDLPEPAAADDHRAAGRRPTIIVTRTEWLPFVSVVQIVPLTNSTGRVAAGEVRVTLEHGPSKAQANALTTVNWTQLDLSVGGYVDSLSYHDVVQVDDALRAVLDL